MIKKIIGIFLMMLLIGTAIPTFGMISEVKDQYQEQCDECDFFENYAWQQFVPSISNLTRVEVYIAEHDSPYDITLSIEKPLDTVLTSLTLSNSSIPSQNCGWASFDVRNETLTIGSIYYIVLEYPSGGEYSWGGAWEDPYIQGDSSVGGGWDFCFRTFCEEETEFVQGVCGQTITESVTLTENIGPCDGPGIIIGASGITLDGDGYKIIGNGNDDGVICEGFDNVVIEHLFVENFENGIVFYGQDNQVVLSSIRNNAVGILLSGNSKTIQSGTTVNENIIADNGIGISTECNNNNIYHNLIVNNDQQIQDIGGNTWEDNVNNYGNFWGNYWGVDDGSNSRPSGDFIGDTYIPHEGVDNNPLLNPTIWGGGFLMGPGGSKWWLVASSFLVWRGGWSPVEITVSDPLGNTITNNENNIGSMAFYVEDEEFITGTKMVQTIILINTTESFEGTYSCEMHALDDLDYWVEYYGGIEEEILIQHVIPYGILLEGETQYLNMTVDDDMNFYISPFANAGPDQFISNEDQVFFDGSDSVDPDGVILSYMWDFGDGDIGSGVNTSHSYDTGGMYTVFLSVEDDDGLTDVDSMIVVYNHPPDTPIKPSGSTLGDVGISYSYQTKTDDPEGDLVMYGYNWGDGSDIEWTSFYTPNSPVSLSHSWDNIGVYNIQVKAEDINGGQSGWSEILSVDIGGANTPPVTPLISGNTNGEAGTDYEYTFTTTDPEGNDIHYYIEWGDEDIIEWDGPHSSGDQIIFTHIWEYEDTYTIRCKAKDAFDAESEWGELEVSMPKSKTFIFRDFLIRFLDDHPLMFPVLRQILGLT